MGSQCFCLEGCVNRNNAVFDSDVQKLTNKIGYFFVVGIFAVKLAESSADLDALL